MDDRRFDDMIKAICGPIRTRRTLAGGLLAALLPGAIGAKGKSKRGSKGGKKSGKGKGHGKKPHERPGHLGPPVPGEDDCEAFFNNPEQERDCKAIRRTCRAPDHLCLFAVDHPGPEDLRGVACCPEHKTCCIFGCTDTNNDPKNCGPCGQECFHDQVCSNGECICDDAACLPGGVCCGEGCCGGPNFPHHRCCDGRCLDTYSDPANCGQCGKTCGAGQICRGGECVCNDAACPHGKRCIKNNQYYCSGDADPGCTCGCGGTYTYCDNYFGPGKGACISPGATCQDVTRPNGAAS